ncbi:MAG: 4-(cytidine 5'-diphospho)-2-C-methyl-D-erythritol kinase, partial [Alphaproteobacteria bacterium]|nr:4-(cytidine 5'-diphospho)-2-C-methyl-D-erythritol kinase [Alphaproteobacteria bacterium]
MPQPFHVFAPAKLNLFLHVTGKRADGYHALQSLMVFADIGDDLFFAEQDGFTVESAGPFAMALPKTGDNLVAKAARLLAEEYRVPLRGKITLEKNLPVASGIGGGSADAAAALRGLARLWNLPEDQPRLQKLGFRLGADVPACLASRAAFADGAGEILTQAENMPA